MSPEANMDTSPTVIRATSEELFGSERVPTYRATGPSTSILAPSTMRLSPERSATSCTPASPAIRRIRE